MIPQMPRGVRGTLGALLQTLGDGLDRCARLLAVHARLLHQLDDRMARLEAQAGLRGLSEPTPEPPASGEHQGEPETRPESAEDR